MANFNEYMNVIDFSELRNLFLKKGKSIEIKKKAYLIRQNEPYGYIGFIESGIFRYARIDSEGKEHILPPKPLVISVRSYSKNKSLELLQGFYGFQRVILQIKICKIA